MTVPSDFKKGHFFTTGAPLLFRANTPSTSSSSPYTSPSYYYGGHNLLEASDGYPAFTSTKEYQSLNPNPIGESCTYGISIDLLVFRRINSLHPAR